MIRNVILHLHGELPLKADIESLPTAADAGLLCTNLRTLEGRKPLSTEFLDSVFLIPYNIIRFIEIPRASIDQAGLGMDSYPPLWMTPSPFIGTSSVKAASQKEQSYISDAFQRNYSALTATSVTIPGKVTWPVLSVTAQR